MTATIDSAPIEVAVPDIGGFGEVVIIEVFVHEGDVVSAEDSLITLESDKATMDVPAPAGGSVAKVFVKVGDTVSEGTPILELVGAATETIDLEPAPIAEPPALPAASAPPAPKVQPQPPQEAGQPEAGQLEAGQVDPGQVVAGPSVRRMAREFDIDLTTVPGTGPKSRVTKDDLRNHLAGTSKNSATPAGGGALGGTIPPVPAQDFSVYGPIESRALSRIKRLSGPLLHRSWLNIPHVTHNDEADITDLEAFRLELDTAAKEQGYRVTLLAFLVKASVSALRMFPEVNSSLSPEQDALILKRYYNLGIAVDTPDGLVVPVVKDADRKGITELSHEFASLSGTAREGKLSPAQMSGASFTISSLGGIGGTSFTPIVNAPEVAILGVVRSVMKPVWDGTDFQPRLMLPLSLSYDHRVIDGALAARFLHHLCDLLSDPRRLLL